MHTALTSFASDFSQSVRPVVQPLEEAVGEVAALGDQELDRDVLPELRRVRDQLAMLLTKVESQQSYVLIFGPLKSGKSTLMNALAGDYVSEVTSLPAYPCVVFLARDEATSHRITYYDGSVDEVADAAELHARIDAAHVELAREIRRVEADGRQFDPVRDFPRAIKRVDVRMPECELSSTRTALVDTPGLYSHMKFGYDAMTQDFRHAAAVAVFVVKADNIFLEQVFEEFAELLQLFSRVFLVLNVDSTKMDLGPDGELRPSLEQTDPERVVRAFSDLTMNAALKEAQEDGRLTIYPIDLLRAASARMRGESTADADETVAAFEHFQSDLGRFLDSGEYVNAFIKDGLARAYLLLGQAEEACSHDAVRRFVARLEELVAERDRENRLLATLDELRKRSWDEELTEHRRRLDAAVRERARAVSAKLDDELDEKLDAWFRSDASLQALNEGTLAPRLEAGRRNVLAFAEENLRRSARAAELVPAGLNRRAREAGVDLETIALEALEGVVARGAEEPPVRPPVRAAAVPVRRGFLDWVLFRGRDAVRRRVLGPESKPDRKIDAARKGRALGASARSAMRAAVVASREELLQATVDAVGRDLHAAWADEVAEGVTNAVAARHGEVEPRVREIDADLASRKPVPRRLDTLREALRGASIALQDVREANAPKVDIVELYPAGPGGATSTAGGEDEAAAAAAGPDPAGDGAEADASEPAAVEAGGADRAEVQAEDEEERRRDGE